MSEVLAEDFPSGREFEDLLTDLDSAGVEILDEPKLDFEKKVEEGEDFGDLDLATEGSDKTNDPVRMYLREMGTVPLADPRRRNRTGKAQRARSMGCPQSSFAVASRNPRDYSARRRSAPRRDPGAGRPGPARVRCHRRGFLRANRTNCSADR